MDANYFQSLYQQPDPWGYRTRWYEQRKRALVLAMLHRRRYRRALELACSIGETTVALAMRCDELIATDANALAAGHARRRTRILPHVRILRMQHPNEWPEGRFDLVVFAELGYYMDPPDLLRTATHIRDCLDDNAMVVACHWRRPIDGCPQTGDQVHDLLHRELRLPRMARHGDDDLLLDAWSTDGRSVATIEGLA